MTATEIATIRSGVDVAPQSGLGVEYTFSPQLVTLSDPSGEQAEAVRVVRTHLMAQHLEKGRRALAVCAASRGVGCTFIAANLAVALSQIGVKTVLVDGDLGNPGVGEMIRASSLRGGLAQCLSSKTAHYADCIDFEAAPNLSVIYAGHSDTPGELLASDRFQMLMDYCLRDFDMTIVDTPPANVSSDVRRISTVVGYSLLVAGSNRSYVNDVKVLVEQLRADHAKVVGTVLNWA